MAVGHGLGDAGRRRHRRGKAGEGARLGRVRGATRSRIYRGAGLPLQLGAHAKGTGGGHGCRPGVLRLSAGMGLCGPAAGPERIGSGLRARPNPKG
jgi:hypothetical protein